MTTTDRPVTDAHAVSFAKIIAAQHGAETYYHRRRIAALLADREWQEQRYAALLKKRGGKNHG